MKLSIVVLFALTSVLACAPTGEETAPNEDQASVSGSHGLRLSVAPRSAAYARTGPMEVDVTLVNATDSVVRLRPIFSFGRWLDADIRGPSGELLENTAAIDPPNAWPVTLEPGQSITETVDLRCSLPVTPGVPCTAPYDMTRPGQYEIVVRFTVPCDIRGCERMITTTASPIRILVGG